MSVPRKYTDPSRLPYISWSFCFASALLVAISCGVPLAYGQDSLRNQVLNLNRQLSTNGGSVMQLLQQRQAAVDALIRQSPAAVRSVALDPAEVRRLTAAAPNAVGLIEKAAQWSGPLELLAEDDFEDNRAVTHWRVRTAKGPVELFFAHGAPPIQPACSPRVTVAGIGTAKNVAVDSVVAMSNPPPTCSTTGVQHIAVILLTMPGATVFPAGFDSAYFQQLFFANSGYSLNTYWQEASYGQASAAGQVFGPFALSQSFPCEQSDSIATAAIQAASSVDFTQFDRVALIFPVSTCSFGGLGTIGCWETIVPGQNISIAWLPIFPYQQTYNYVGTVTHETGHNLGLNHSNTVDYGSSPIGAFDDAGSNVEYGDPFSVMGQVWTVDGTQKIFGQYNAQHKSEDLGWLSLSNGEYQEVTSGGSFTVAPLEASSGLRALRVLRDPSIGEWLWLEYRQPLGTVDSTFSLLPDLGEPTSIFDGALVHLEDPFLDPLHSYLADFNAVAAPNDFYHSPLAPGHTWSDPYSPLTVSVSSAGPSGLSATVSYDATCATLATSGSPFLASGGSGTITVTAPSGCAWTAATSTPWISLSGGTSGSGNGTVNFSVATSPGGLPQRNGYIAVQRQSVPIAEAGTGSLILGASPSFGTGRSARITFSFSDPHGFADISSASIGITGCSMLILPGSSSLFLLNDAGTQYLPTLNLTAAGTSVSNSQCTASSTGSTITGNGNGLQITLQLTFAASFAGSHSITAGLADGQGNYTPLPVATWRVPLNVSGASQVALAPTSLAFGNRPVGSPSLPLTITLTNGGTALLNISNIAITGANPGDFSLVNSCTSTLAISASCTVAVTFTPSAPGSRSATLTISDNAPGASQSAPLTGSGGMIPDVSLSSANLIFAGQTVGTSSAPSTIVVSNQGSDVLTISQISVTGNNPGDFIETNDCGAALAAGANCNVSVVFSPSGVGSRLAAVSMLDNAAGSPHTVSLSGPAMDFSLATSDASTSATVSAGQTATYHLDVSGQNGFAGSVTIACADSVPQSSCSASSAAPLQVSSAAVPFTVSVSTTASTSVAAASGFGKPSGWGLSMLVFALLLFPVVPMHRRLTLSFALLLCCFSLNSCGGGGTSAPPTVHGTPSGTYQITVNATSSGITRPISLTLKVQ